MKHQQRCRNRMELSGLESKVNYINSRKDTVKNINNMMKDQHSPPVKKMMNEDIEMKEHGKQGKGKKEISDGDDDDNNNNNNKHGDVEDEDDEDMVHVD